MPHRRDVVVFLATLAFAAASATKTARAEPGGERQQQQQQRQPTASASAASSSGGVSLGTFRLPWADATASISSVTASAACSLFGRESSLAARDSRMGLATAAACDVATNLELWLQPLLGGGGGGITGAKKRFLPPGATRAAPVASASDALAADRAAVASTATAAASTASSSSTSSSATANARPVCAAASLFPGAGSGLLDGGGGGGGGGGGSRVLLPVCQAPSIEVVADAGRCAVESRPPHAVVCVGPSVTLEITPPRCSLSYYGGDDGGGDGGGASPLFAPPSRSLVVDSVCGPPLSAATGGGRVFLGGKAVPVSSFTSLNDSGGGSGGASLADYDRAASALSSWPDGWGGSPLADARGLAELLAVALLPGRVTATASVVED